ncbi:MAG: hypothetical protein PHF68_01850 [Candidatus ainarchaeum sp.]|jgi:uncharacterized membrane protein YdjX (TVP38/TMEM64 family)|nr:hypothetical protein [Candidatus ainarchaeum sp.]
MFNPDLGGFNQRGFISLIINETTYYKDQIGIVLKRTKLFAYKYPKIILFILISILAFYLFHNNFFSDFISNLGQFVFLGEFIGGVLFSFGLTTPFAIAIFLKITPQNIFLASLIGGCGALISDLLIFKFIKISFEDEFDKLKKERPFLFMKKHIHTFINPTITHYLTFAFAGILFASPLPDEAAIMVLAGITKINLKTLALVSFVCNSIGIFFILLI